MTIKKKNKYNHYTEEFRREAVRRSDDPSTTAAEVARELGIHPGQIYNWRRQYHRLSDKQFNTVDGVDYSRQERGSTPIVRTQLKRAPGSEARILGLSARRHALPCNGCIVRRLYRPKVRHSDSNCMKNKGITAENYQNNGGPTWTRTRDKRIMSPLL